MVANRVQRGKPSHPELEELADLAAGTAAPGPAERLQEHLAGCVLCRLEVKRLRRFAAIDADLGLVRQARWEETARPALDQVFRERIAPSLGRRVPAPPRRRWPSAAALAAALILLVLGIRQSPLPQHLTEGPGPVRGGNPAAEAIVPLAPVGLVGGVPERFEWTAAASFSSFALEIFTPGLEVVFGTDGITDPSFAVGDSLAGLLQPGQTYLWSVQGYAGHKPGPSSPEVWFTLPGE